MPAFPEGLQPRTRQLPTILRGETYRAKINLYSDVAETVPLNLGPFTITLFAEGVLKLTSGAGLAITAGSGLIVVEQTPAQTLAIPSNIGELHYYLELEETPTEKVVPLNGTIPVRNP